MRSATPWSTDGTDRLSDGAKIKIAAADAAAGAARRRQPGRRPAREAGRSPAPRAGRRRHELSGRTPVRDMNISRLFILRPVATSLLMIALVLVGLVAVRFLPVSSLPDVDYPTIQVQTFYPGASPQVMATTVTAPLEVQLGRDPGPARR